MDIGIVYQGVQLQIETIKTFGQIAGIGGLSLGIFLFLFKEIIKKKIFPQLTKVQAYKIIRLMLILIWQALFVKETLCPALRWEILSTNIPLQLKKLNRSRSLSLLL